MFKSLLLIDLFHEVENYLVWFKGKKKPKQIKKPVFLNFCFLVQQSLRISVFSSR